MYIDMLIYTYTCVNMYSSMKICMETHNDDRRALALDFIDNKRL